MYAHVENLSRRYGRGARPGSVIVTTISLFAFYLLPLCQQPYPLHARVMRRINHVRHIPKIHPASPRTKATFSARFK